MNQPVARPYRQRRRAASAESTRRRILDSAQKVLIETDSFDIDAVAAAAGVARSTVYRAFGSRSGLIDALAEDLKASGTQPAHLGASSSTALGEGFIENVVLLDRLRALATVERESTATERLAKLDSRVTSPRLHRLLLPSASDISDWARRRDAQQVLPQLIRRLIEATSTLRRLDFRAGEGVALPGWDGISDATGDHFVVPTGLAGWEMGADEQVAQKAQHDYEARVKRPEDLDPSSTTFVFVTPRRWGGKRSWAAKMRAQGVWRDVRTVDADDLETWLETAAFVHVWLAETMGLRPAGVTTLESEWRAWAGNTTPNLTPSLIVGGRFEAATKLNEWSSGPPAALVVRSDSSTDALMFVAASLQLDRERSAAVLEKAVVVRERESWRVMSSSRSPSLLLPLFEDPDVAGAVRNGHRVLTPTGPDEVAAGDVLELPRVRREAAKAALVEAGVADDQAEILGQLARLGLGPLYRRLAISSRRQLPRWASGENARDLLPVLLAGGWDSASEGDRTAMADLAGKSYGEIAAMAARWATSSDPPLRRDGSTWLLVSKEDVWSLLASQLTADDLVRFEAVALDVVGAPDPATELPPDQRWMAAVKGKSRAHTPVLRSGLADTIALLGGHATATILADGRTGAMWAQQIVWRLLQAANGEPSGAAWLSLADDLPPLAEAAPRAFLDALESAVSRAQPPIERLFRDAETSHPFGRATHAGLLWALEGLAWSPEHLPRVTAVLGELASLDPGGRWSNRPENTLREIYLPWHPQTAASLSDRLASIDALRERFPDQAWTLLMALMPGTHEIAMPTHAPRWRAWKVEDALQARHDYPDAIEQVLARAVEDAGLDGARWAGLVEHAERTTSAQWLHLTERLASLSPSDLTADGRRLLADALRSVVQRHRGFPDATWAMPEERLAVLDAARLRFDPDDPVDRHRWLFDDRARLIDVSHGNWSDHYSIVLRMRSDAVRDVLAAPDPLGLERLVEGVANAWHVGWALAHINDAGDFYLDWFQSDRGCYVQAARGYASGRFSEAGASWADKTLVDLAGKWNADVKASLLESLPGRPDVWALVQRAGPEVEAKYWSSFRQVVRPEDATEAALKLLEFGNAHHAVSILGMQASDSGSMLDPDLAIRALDTAASQPFEPGDQAMFGFELAELLKRLDQMGVTTDRLAPIEWAYLPLLRDDSRPILSLHRALAEDARFFAEVVAMVFRGESEEPRQATADESARIRRAWELLNGWRHAPGTSGTGDFDPDLLRAWVIEARQLLLNSGRRAIGDEQIGRALRWGPTHEDGVWPHPAVRDLLQELASPDVERGLVIEVHNSRGVTSRHPTEGGQQERDLAQKYRADAAAVDARWPRTKALLAALADDYDREALFEDARAALNEDT